MTDVRIAIGEFSYSTGSNLGDGTPANPGHRADVDGLFSATNDLTLTLPTDDFSLNSGDTVGFTFTDANGDTVTVTDGVVQQSGFTDGGGPNMSGILTIQGTDQNGDPIALLLRMDGAGISAGQSFFDYDPASSGADVILDEPINTFFLGNYPDVDPVEARNNNNAENAGDLVGASASGTGDLALVAMQPQDNHNTSSSSLGDNDLAGNGQPRDGGDRITYISPSSGEEIIGTIDSSLTYNADLLLSDGSTLSTEVVVIQLTNGDVFVSDLNNAGTLDNLVVESIELTGLTGSNYTSFGDTQSVDGSNVSNAVVDGEETGEVMGPGYNDAGQATNGGGDIIDGADGDNDSILGNGGDDVIDAGAGDDTVDGGADNDTIDGGAGSDSVDGGTGDDSLDGGSGSDTVCGGDGNDTISGGETSGTPLPDEPASPTEHQFTIIDPAAFTALNASGLYFPGWQGEYQGTTDTVQTITIRDLDSASNSGLAAVDNNSAIGPDTDLTLERVTTTTDQSFNDNDGGGGVTGGQTLLSDYTSPTYGTFGAGSTIFTTTEHRFEEYDENGTYIDDFYVFEVTIGSGGGTENLLVTSKPFVNGHTYESTSRSGLGTVAYDELATFSADPLTIGDDTLCGGAGDDTFIVVEGNDVITDFNTGNTGSITDGDQTNNDFVDLSGYYNQVNYDAAVAAGAIDPNVIKTPLQWLQADQADDGILNDTNAGWDADTTLTLQNGGAPVDGSDLTFDNTNVACFARDTLIKTSEGEIAVQELKVGDRILTMDSGYQALRWIGAHKVLKTGIEKNEKLRPIRILAGALGNNLPEIDLIVSRQHRVLIRSKIAKRMFGEAEILIPAVKLLGLDGVDIAHDIDQVEYWHFMFDAHQIVWSNGAATESLFTGPEALKAVAPESREEINALFPHICEPGFVLRPARPVPDKGRRMRKLAERHRQSSVPLFTHNSRTTTEIER